MVRDIATAAIVIAIAAAFGVQYLGQGTPGQQAEPLPEPVAVEGSNAPHQARKASSGKGSTGVSGIGQTVVLKSDGRGHFEAQLQVNGIAFPALVDTGATVIALPLSLAEKLGYFPASNAFTASVSTANGIVKAAPVILREVRLGAIEIRNVETLILPDASLADVLLGMSFLSKLKSFAINGGELTLVN